MLHPARSLASLENTVKEERWSMGNILIVEDDPNIRKLVRVNLVKRGYIVFEAEDSHQAMECFQTETIDLVLLDLVLPGLSGVDVCGWMRARSDVPIIVLSARSEEELKVAALDAGADDYVTKPFGQEELLARVRAFLRRSYSVPNIPDTKIQIGELRIDLSARRVFIGEEDLHLTRTEYAILAELAQHPNAIVTHDELIAQVWGPEYRGSNHYLHNYLGRLRKKLGEYGHLLETVPGMGYNLHVKIDG
jgi:two-component system, OmpR family, KDP operon response regulator KdpE